VISAARLDGATVETRRKENRPTLVGWQPRDEEQTRRLRREADRITNMKEDDRQQEAMYKDKQEGERWREGARGMVRSAKG
jgi:hypothetical protein